MINAQKLKILVGNEDSNWLPHGHKSLYVSTINSDWFSSFQVVIIFYIYMQTFTEVSCDFLCFLFICCWWDYKWLKKSVSKSIQATPSIQCQIFCPLTFAFLRSYETSFIPTKGGWSLVFRLIFVFLYHSIKLNTSE